MDSLYSIVGNNFINKLPTTEVTTDTRMVCPYSAINAFTTFHLLYMNLYLDNGAKISYPLGKGAAPLTLSC